MDNQLVYKDESYKIIGAALEVHKQLGCGFIEQVYQDALEYEFRLRGIPFEREKAFQVIYKDIVLDKTFRVDFVCFDKIIVELKAVSCLADEHTAQVLNYLKASNLKLGLLINFGETWLVHERVLPLYKWNTQQLIQ